jgi:hypothetical protein
MRLIADDISADMIGMYHRIMQKVSLVGNPELTIINRTVT